MSKHAALGFQRMVMPHEPQVIVGDLYKLVKELDHAPGPLREIREIVYSGSYKHAARRHMIEMEAEGVPFELLKVRLGEETPFFRVRLKAELALLPEETALEATTSEQAKICERALLLARRREVEGFELSDPRRAWPRMLILADAFEEAVEVDRRDLLVPADLLPDDLGELFKYGPSLSLGD